MGAAVAEPTTVHRWGTLLAAHDGRTTPDPRGTGGISPRWPSHWRPTPPACRCPARLPPPLALPAGESSSSPSSACYTLLASRRALHFLLYIRVPLRRCFITSSIHCYLSQQDTAFINPSSVIQRSVLDPVGHTQRQRLQRKMKLVGGQRRQRGFGKALKEQRARLYIIQRCVVMLLRWHD
ncbi:unnamed protein product [Urochloa humidicola]